MVKGCLTSAVARSCQIVSAPARCTALSDYSTRQPTAFAGRTGNGEVGYSTERWPTSRNLTASRGTIQVYGNAKQPGHRRHSTLASSFVAPYITRQTHTRTFHLQPNPTKAKPASLTRSIPAQHRSFHTTKLLSQEKSHYQTLGVEPTVSRADLKKRFYALSKEVHPDVNKSPNASERFSEVSEAYTILGNEEKRRKYDREVMPRFTKTRSRSSEKQSGTYAGSRAPTGLSKRRGTFRGPPPSFYGRESKSDEETMRREQEAWSAGGGQFDARAFMDRSDPFNSDPVLRTQKTEDMRRRDRRAAEMAAAQAYADEEGNFWVRFVLVSGLLGFVVAVGTAVNRINNTPRGGMTKGDGSRRERAGAS